MKGESFLVRALMTKEVATVALTNRTTSRESAPIAGLPSTTMPILFSTMESGTTVEQPTNEGGAVTTTTCQSSPSTALAAAW